MKKLALSLALSGLTLATVAARPASVTGTYVEARTAEVFAGACIMNGEAATTGREALLAWKVDRGSVNGVSAYVVKGQRFDRYAADSAMHKFTVKLTQICVRPSSMLCENTDPCSGETNCGKIER